MSLVILGQLTGLGGGSASDARAQPPQRLGGTWKQKPLCRLIPSLCVLCLCVRVSLLGCHWLPLGTRGHAAVRLRALRLVVGAGRVSAQELLQLRRSSPFIISCASLQES